MKIVKLAALGAVMFAGTANAATVTGMFSGEIDLSSLGGSAGAAYSVEFTFDSNDTGTDLGPFNPGRNIFRYFNIDGSATIGADTFSFTDAAILIENDNSLPFDSYLFSTQPGITNGTLLGQSLDSLDFQLFDLTANALSSTALVTSDFNPLDFSNVQTFVELAGDGDGLADAYTFTPISDGSEFSLTFSQEPPISAVPLPAGMPLLLGGLAVFGLIRRKRAAA